MSGVVCMEGFKSVIPYVVRVADINYGGHVANSAVLDFFHEGRIAYLAALGPFDELDLGGCGLIMAEARVRYRAEMKQGDRLQIGVRIPALEGSTGTMEYRIEREGKVTAEGETRLVAFDYSKRRPTRWPEGFRAAVSAFEQD